MLRQIQKTILGVMCISLLASCNSTSNSPDTPDQDTGDEIAVETATAVPAGAIPAMAVTGPIEVIYDWSEDNCAPDDSPDMPFRPFRDAEGRVQANRSWPANRRFIGDSLDTIQPVCDITYVSHKDPDPGNYRFDEWIQAVYTEDGQTIYALLHNEHNSHSVGDPGNTGYWNITYAVSTDGGDTFQAPEPPDNFVASSPYPYELNKGIYGVASGSNIMKGKDGYYYMLALNWLYGDRGQGTCLLRTDDLSDPASWIAWDGAGFNMRMVNPYFETGFVPTDHECPAVDDGSGTQIGNMFESLIYNSYLDKYIVASSSISSGPGGSNPFGAITYSFSDDLHHWTARKVFLKFPADGTHSFVDEPTMAYAVLIDPDSESRSFDTADQDAYIYFTRHNNREGISLWDQDLVRFPVKFFWSEAEAQEADVRTNLFFSVEETGASVSIKGNLLSLNRRNPIRNAPIEVSAIPNDAHGEVYEYTVTYTVPENATRAAVGYRVNTECRCSGDSDFYIYNFAYSENGSPNLVPNDSFQNSLNFYHSFGTGSRILESSDAGEGQMMHVTASDDQYVGFYSDEFPVTPGAEFTYTVTSRVVPGSQGSGYFALFFNTTDSTNPLRITIPIEPIEKEITTLSTNEEGRFGFTWTNADELRYILHIRFLGNDIYWPSEYFRPIGDG